MNCPSCRAPLALAGHTYKCQKCDGAWVKSDVLIPMLEQVTASIVALPWEPNIEPHVRACPECGTSMATVKLGSVALDRCGPHGVWFDYAELAALLREAKEFRVPPHHDGILKTLGKLLH